MKLFSGLGGRRNGSLDINDEGTPSFIEVSETNQKSTGNPNSKGYKAPGLKNSPSLLDADQSLSSSFGNEA